MRTFLRLSVVLVAMSHLAACIPLLDADLTEPGKWYDGPRFLAVLYVCERPDDDGCSDPGWSAWGESCYAIGEDLATYTEASLSCEALGAQLVSIESAQENAHVQSLCDRRACWIGLAEPEDSERWFWPNGEPVGTAGEWSGYTNWNEGEPNNYGDRDEDATFMNYWGHLGEPQPWSPREAANHVGRWHDGPRGMSAWFVCEQAADGLSCPAGWSRFEDSCHAVSDAPAWYDEAVQSCREQGATLVDIQSAAENAQVADLCEQRACWVGLTEPPDSEEWLWGDGTTAGTKGAWSGYTNWDDGEPNNHGGRDEDATFMNYWGYFGLQAPRSPSDIKRHLGKWYDGPRDMPAWYVCERAAEAGSCGEDGWVAYGASCYQVSEDLESYPVASQACAREDAQLVRIDSPEENTHVQQMCGHRTCWLGLAEPPDSEEWLWADGAHLGTKGEWSGYTNWDGDEPNNWGGTDEDATFMNLWLHLDRPEPWKVKRWSQLKKIAGFLHLRL